MTQKCFIRQTTSYKKDKVVLKGILGQKRAHVNS